MDPVVDDAQSMRTNCAGELHNRTVKWRLTSPESVEIIPMV